ncbi:unnamed protein product [Trichogramma brassicae]|uniref:Translation initiation factor eIF2B subunit delta n=1 Tax=Trichogramma brassicae TaxID=86971 RepID=A0A6H5ICS3_9HYME|nr:unnamed protein product [Trichogramma brassicae]
MALESSYIVQWNLITFPTNLITTRSDKYFPRKIGKSAEKTLLKTQDDKVSTAPANTVRVRPQCKKTNNIKDSVCEVKLFKHLYSYNKNSSIILNPKNMNVHPSILKLGIKYANKIIVGSNSRCVAFLNAIKDLINDYTKPANVDFTRGLKNSIQESLSYLDTCRPSSANMFASTVHLEGRISTLPLTMTDDEVKRKLTNIIDDYIEEQILLADRAISNSINKKIMYQDTLVVYGFSSLIYSILLEAHKTGKNLKIIVVDGHPWLEGRELLRRLSKHGIDCSYMMMNALSFVMPQVIIDNLRNYVFFKIKYLIIYFSTGAAMVNKVLLGAHAILANGAVMARVGTSQIALTAKAFSVPVLVVCGAHKSCERVQTDSFVYNEIGDPDFLLENSLFCIRKRGIVNWKSKKSLSLLNITYDVTPANLVNAVITELAVLHGTSIPVILRLKPSEI